MVCVSVENEVCVMMIARLEGEFEKIVVAFAVLVKVE